MARLPSLPMTLVATRSMSPASFIRWKMVAREPVMPSISSTIADLTLGSAFAASAAPPMRAPGRVTGAEVRETWSIAVHDTAGPVNDTPPPRFTVSRATLSDCRLSCSSASW